MTQISELVDKDTKTVIIIVLHVFQKWERNDWTY
jgi:hypothetical protein